MLAEDANIHKINGLNKADEFKLMELMEMSDKHGQKNDVFFFLKKVWFKDVDNIEVEPN